MIWLMGMGICGGSVVLRFNGSLIKDVAHGYRMYGASRMWWLSGVEEVVVYW